MKITFGKALDGAELRPANDSLGDIVCGPLRLMEILETQLGLRRKPLSDVTRIFQFVKVLETLAGNKSRFYSASFEKDQLSVSETLLNWRDSLVLAGWNGNGNGSSKRLHDLADINAAFTDAALAGHPERLVAIRDSLAQRNNGVEEIVVVDPPAAFSRLWCEVLTKLSAKFRIPEKGLGAIHNEQQTDLQQLASALDSTSPAEIKWQNDGTVIQFSAYSEFTLAHMATELLRANSNEACALVAGNDCGLLDGVLIAADQASLGVHSMSLARPIPQLLLLALRLCWKPLNPLHLLEFLTHPDTPVEFHLRNELSRALVECPGIGGPKWLAAIEGVKEIYRAKPAEEAKRLLPRLENDLAEWIHIAKYEVRLGSPGSELANRCQHIAKWARQQNIREQEQDNFAKASLFQCLAAQAAELGAALQESDKVTQCQLERLIKRVSGGGWSSPRIRELGHCHRICSPAACVESADIVLWWNFSEPQTPALPHWTISEVEELRRHGAEIPSAASILAVESAQWLRPFWAARKKLMFFTPRKRKGEPVVTHPLLSRIQAVVEGKFPRTDLDMALQRKRISCADKIGHAALPTARRWWKLKDGKHFGIRPVESFSSAEKFIYSPYAWVLDYKAVLRPGVSNQFRMRSENVLSGNLLHRLLDLLGEGPIKQSNWAAITDGELKEHLEKQWPTLLEQEGATLLLLGKQSEAAALLDTGKRALWTLAQQLKAAQITETETNVNFKTDFIGGQLEGFVDLLVKNESSRSSVIDLKSGRMEEKKKELQSNVHLQLAIYGFLHRQNRAEWPSAAYFILNNGRMLAQTKDYFPLASSVTTKAGTGGLEICWNEFVEMWRYRRALLDQGWIELTLGITESQNGNQFPDPAPFEHWRPAKDHDKYNDFRALTGLEENA
jgi:PD-(D/E)XK nuclease superfamily